MSRAAVKRAPIPAPIKRPEEEEVPREDLADIADEAAREAAYRKGATRPIRPPTRGHTAALILASGHRPTSPGKRRPLPTSLRRRRPLPISHR